MATSVIINNETYSISQQGASPPWGTDIHDVINALVESVNNLQGSNDILLTSFTIANNQSSVANVTSLAFDTSVVRSAIIEYSIYRYSDAPIEHSETGFIFLSYKSIGASWEIAQQYSGTSGVTFSITSAGQVQYTSTDLGGTVGSRVGKLKFRARTFLQT